MKQTALLEFESAAFSIEPGEDEETNPGIFGKSLAQWMADQLRSTGIGVGEVIAEDFGWCVPVVSKPHRFYVCCTGSAEKPGYWQVFAFVESGIIARRIGKNDNDESLATLFAAIRRVLEASPTAIKNLRQEEI